jgi:RHS repeat-associated protein
VLFQGAWYDAETMLYQMRFRYLQPSLGTWISRDPISEDGGYNLYTMANNSPVNQIDFYGLDPEADIIERLDILMPKRARTGSADKDRVDWIKANTCIGGVGVLCGTQHLGVTSYCYGSLWEAQYQQYRLEADKEKCPKAILWVLAYDAPIFGNPPVLHGDESKRPWTQPATILRPDAPANSFDSGVVDGSSLHRFERDKPDDACPKYVGGTLNNWIISMRKMQRPIQYCVVCIHNQFGTPGDVRYGRVPDFVGPLPPSPLEKKPDPPAPNPAPGPPKPRPRFFPKPKK